MKFNLQWFKKHPAAAGIAVVVGLLVIYLVVRQSGSSSSSGGITGLAENQQAGELQLAQLNAQANAQQTSLNTQLTETEYQSNLQAEEAQDQLVGSLANTVIPAQLEANIYGEQIGAAESVQTSLAPAEETLVKELSSGSLAGHEAEQESSLNALELLLSESNPALGSSVGGLNFGAINQTPAKTSLGLNLGNGLFGIGYSG